MKRLSCLVVPYRHVRGKLYGEVKGGTKLGVVFRPAKKEASGKKSAQEETRRLEDDPNGTVGLFLTFFGQLSSDGSGLPPAAASKKC
jgi:hypothetical protein